MVLRYIRRTAAASVIQTSESAQHAISSDGTRLNHLQPFHAPAVIIHRTNQTQTLGVDCDTSSTMHHGWTVFPLKAV
jgi:hypothetical protein|eukprot:COSAG06_NODE_1433_length_9477_cov_69.462301_11_plen_77_part_00